MLAQDIVSRVKRDFDVPDEAALVLSVLVELLEQDQVPSTDRILRCIIYVAGGDLDVLDKAIDLAKIDYRDLIVWAEYEGMDSRVRDFSKPFPE